MRKAGSCWLFGTMGLSVALAAGAALAQGEGPAAVPGQPAATAPAAATGGRVASSVLLLNQDRLLTASRYGERIQREVEAAGSQLAAENRRIEAQLTEEELQLTQRRAQMSADEFRPLAEEFDNRVEAIRAAQEAKGRALQAQAEAAQASFFELVFPILVDLLRQRGAGVMIDSRAVLLSVEGVDITDEAIARVDAQIGEGGPEPLIDLDGTASPATP